MQAIMFVPFSLKLIFPCIPHNYSVSKKPHNVVVVVLNLLYVFYFFTNVHIFVGKFFVFW